jgi:hypothetical protein
MADGNFAISCHPDSLREVIHSSMEYIFIRNVPVIKIHRGEINAEGFPVLLSIGIKTSG